MGALHEGHLSLVRLAGQSADRVAASVFVNPKQFAAHEDLSRYPRDEAGDAAKLAGAGCQLLYAPTLDQIYPLNFSTSVHVAGLSESLEGKSRPHFFGGVATVVTKLLLQALPDIAVFGEKDYQQLLVIRRLSAVSCATSTSLCRSSRARLCGRPTGSPCPRATSISRRRNAQSLVGSMSF
jgi:pantoate--beta-alanine ligase